MQSKRKRVCLKKCSPFKWTAKIMNYLKNYIELIEYAKHNANYSKYGELHHILPKSLNGKDTKENLVYLSARQHFLAHYLLYKIYQNSNNISSFKKMKKAFLMMNLNSNYQNRYINSRLYEAAKIKKISSKEIYCFETKEIFSSPYSAALKFNISATNIYDCCKGNQLTAAKKHFFYKNKEDNYQIKEKNYNTKKIICINDGKIYDSIEEASKHYNITARSISNKVKEYNLNISSGIIQFAEYKKDKIYNLIKKNYKGRKVYCFETKEIFERIGFAAEKYNIPVNQIKSVLANLQKTCHGFSFKYL